MNKRTHILIALVAALPSSAVLACASCGCSINSDWSAQGLSATGGWSLDLRYDYLNQNKLWAGTGSISPTAAAAVTVPQTGDPAEVEQYTRNDYLTATLDYSNGTSWGLSLSLPVIKRSHSTLGVGSDGTTFDPENGAYTSSGSGLGDVRVLGRYFGFTEMRNLGVQLGLKLPTGKKNQVANDGSLTDVDPGLQRGTGTTDLIVGAYYFGDLATDWGYFTQVTFQAALNHSTMAGGSYKPGDNLNVSIGARYRGFASFVPTVQINARYAKTDSGEAADTFATGGKLVYLTLGGILPVSPNFAPYANVQVPIYQNVNGIQLTPKYTVSVGARYTF
jgi:hypothetical protein